MQNPPPSSTPPITLNPERIAVVIPALNEALRIRDVVESALRHCPNVIVVDDVITSSRELGVDVVFFGGVRPG